MPNYSEFDYPERAGVETHSEFGGGGPMRNTVMPKGDDALTASDKLRLGYITGEDDSARTLVRPHHFYGHPEVYSAEIEQILRQAQAREQNLRQLEANRYRTLPY